MNYLSKYRNNKATVCTDKACVTVYGKAAEFVTAVVVVTVSLVAISWLAKAFK